MKKESHKCNSLFIESVNNHQRLVDILVQYRDENGISLISQPQMARLMNHSQTWVAKAIKRLNTEDVCIEMIASGKYVVNYTNILAQGVFNEILKLIVEVDGSPTLFHETDSTLAIKRGVKVKTIQMFKSYLRTR